MTRDDDTSALLALSDVPAALGLLSRLPIHVNTGHATQRGARAAWAYPLAGFALAFIAGCVSQVGVAFGLSASLVAGLALATLIITSGALHEDGLSDAADGLWGGWDKARRLDIMKDSRIGAYGVIALILGVGLRWQTLGVIFDTAIWSPLIVAAMLSRASMVPLMVFLPNARDTGLSHSVGRPSGTTAMIAVGIAAIAALILFKFMALVLIGVAAIAALGCALIAKAKIGGQTGDILGATQQITEIAVLLTLAAVL